MNPNDRKQRRRALTRCFFFHNRTAAFLAMSAVILNIPLNLAVAWQMQQLIDIAAGSPSAFTLPQIKRCPGSVLCCHGGNHGAWQLCPPAFHRTRGSAIPGLHL